MNCIGDSEENCKFDVGVKGLANILHIAVCLFTNILQMTSKCGKKKRVTHRVQPRVLQIFLPHFDISCDLLLYRLLATWSLFFFCRII